MEVIIVVMAGLLLQVIVLRFALSIPDRLKMQAAQLKLQILMAKKAGVEQSEIDKALKNL